MEDIVCANCIHSDCSIFIQTERRPCLECCIYESKYNIPYRNFKPKHPLNEAKYDSGKPKLSLVPQQIIWDIAKVREYGNEKYGDPENWRTVEPERYRDAAFRHFLKYLDDPYGVDEESGLPHLWHLATNCAFLCELEKGEFNG